MWISNGKSRHSSAERVLRSKDTIKARAQRPESHSRNEEAAPPDSRCRRRAPSSSRRHRPRPRPRLPRLKKPQARHHGTRTYTMKPLCSTCRSPSHNSKQKSRGKAPFPRPSTFIRPSIACDAMKHIQRASCLRNTRFRRHDGALEKRLRSEVAGEGLFSRCEHSLSLSLSLSQKTHARHSLSLLREREIRALSKSLDTRPISNRRYSEICQILKGRRSVASRSLSSESMPVVVVARDGSDSRFVSL